MLSNFKGNLAARLYSANLEKVPIAKEYSVQVNNLFLKGEATIPSVLNLSHYRAAVQLHKHGDIDDSELTGLALLVTIAEPPSSLRPKLLQKDENFYCGLPQEFRSGKPSPFMELLSHNRIRSVKNEAQLALLGWHLRLFPGRLAFGSVTAEELLRAQARGYRYVGIQFAHSVPNHQVYKRGFIQHDLCHLAKFRDFQVEPENGNRSSYFPQVGLFAWLDTILPDIKAVVSDELGYQEIQAVIADMNGDVRFLFMALIARLSIALKTEKSTLIPWLMKSLLGVYEGLRAVHPVHQTERLRAMREAFNNNRIFFLDHIASIFAQHGANVLRHTCSEDPC